MCVCVGEREKERERVGGGGGGGEETQTASQTEGEKEIMKKRKNVIDCRISFLAALSFTQAIRENDVRSSFFKT